MARFDRKVERTKKSFEFTQKEKIVETNKDIMLDHKEEILNIRVGGTSFSSVFGLRRSIDYSIYDAIFKCNFSVCFRAWDYYKFSNRFYRIFN